MTLWPDDVLARTVKAELRKRTKAVRAQMLEAQHRVQSDAVCAQALALPGWTEAQVVGLYVPHVPYREVDVWPVARAAWAAGKQVAVPRWGADLKSMQFACVQTPEDIVRDARGWGAARENALALSPDFMLVPGLLFDAQGRRLGYGAGLYDGYLRERAEARTAPQTWGVCFDFQMAVELPESPGDVRVGGIVTEHRALRSAP